MFEEWAAQKNYSKEMWPILWNAYFQGCCDAPSPYSFYGRLQPLADEKE
jgi:hypothetical protein